MKIIPIFEPYLFSIQYENEEFDELERLFENWTDIEILEEFFESNKNDLKYFRMDIEEAIIETGIEAKAFRKKMLTLLNEDKPELDSLFENLDVNETRIYELLKQKSKRRWLRLYAIRIDRNSYLITGGAIKLTLKMDERPHTQLELDKLDRCKNYLRDNNVFDFDSFKEMLNE